MRQMIARRKDRIRRQSGGRTKKSTGLGHGIKEEITVAGETGVQPRSPDRWRDSRVWANSGRS